MGDVYADILERRTVAEFFAGIGLMRMGLEKHGWSVVFANDIDPLKHKMYRDQFGVSPDFVTGDIHLLEPSNIPSVTLATASFPCTDLSLAGARNGLNGKQSSAFWGFVDLIRSLDKRKPPLLLIENVPGFLTSRDGRDFHQAMRALNALDYSVDVFMIDAKNFVPQSRQRLFVLCKNNVVFEAEPSVPIQYADVFKLRPRAVTEFIRNHPDILWSIAPLPPITRAASTIVDVLDTQHEEQDWWSRERATYLLNQMSASHRIIADHMILGDKWSYGTVFRRIRQNKSMAELRVDGIAGCLRTPKGGSGRQILFKAGFGQYYARLLSPVECARLMGADGFRITVPLNQALFGFGDAVCVPVIEWITQEYLNPLLSHKSSKAKHREEVYA